jgi:hypothetical protein
MGGSHNIDALDPSGTATTIATYSGTYTGTELRVCNANGTVFFIASSSGHNAHFLFSMALNGSGLALLCDVSTFTGNNCTVQGIAQHADTGKIYVTAWFATISSLDAYILEIAAGGGSATTLLHTTSSSSVYAAPKTLDIDYAGSLLCWGQDTTFGLAGKLHTCSLTGSGLATYTYGDTVQMGSLQVNNLDRLIYYFLGTSGGTGRTITTSGSSDTQFANAIQNGAGRLAEDWPTDGHYGTS